MKPNDNTKLLKMISTLQNRLDRVERLRPANAALQVTARMTQPISSVNTNYIVWNFQDSVVFNDGIICVQTSIADVYGDGYNFMIMNEGLYSITFDGFLSPAVADVQVRLYTGGPGEKFSYLTKVAKQMNGMGANGRTGFSATTTYYFKEGDVFSIVLLVPTDTTLLSRTFEGEVNYGTPYLTVAQLTGAYETPAEPNEWYTNTDEAVPPF